MGDLNKISIATLNEKLVAANCGPTFIKRALFYSQAYDGDIDKFICFVEEVENAKEAMVGSDDPELQTTLPPKLQDGVIKDHAGICNGLMQTEYDYNGNCLEYHGYVMSTDID